MVLIALIALWSISSASPSWAGPFDTPDATLATYVQALRAGDKAAVESCFERSVLPPGTPTDFHLPEPLPIRRFVVKKRTAYGAAQAEAWNRKGIVPPASVGDIELRVNLFLDWRPTDCLYLLRRFGSDWKIISHACEGDV